MPPDAAPTELGGSCGTCGYKHGAPDGAFRITAAISAFGVIARPSGGGRVPEAGEAEAGEIKRAA